MGRVGWKVEDGRSKMDLRNVANSLLNRMASGATWQFIPYGGVGIRSMEPYIYIYIYIYDFSFCRGDLGCT